MSAMPRLLVVDDDPFTLATLTSTFQSLGVRDVVAVRTAAEAIAEISTKRSATQPIAAVVDLDLGEGPTGIDLAHRLRKIVPQIGIVVLSTYAEPRLIGSHQPPLPPHALYVVKQSIDDPKFLLDAVLQSLTHDHAGSSTGNGSASHAGKDASHADKGASHAGKVSSRTGRTSKPSSGAITRLRDNQVEIMRLVASGLTNAQIAQELLMSEKAVEKSVARLIKQLGIATSREYNQRVLIAQEYYRMTRGSGRGA
jgi:two-component system invasion response regulator UvrY